LSGQAIASAGNSSLQGGLAALGTWTASLTMPLTVLCAAVALWIARDVYRVGRAVDAALVIGLSAPILSPISWIHHWVYLVPAAVTVLFRLRSPLQFGSAALGLAIVYCGPSMGQQFIETSPLLLPVGLVLGGFPDRDPGTDLRTVAVAHDGACVGVGAGLRRWLG